MSVKTLRDYYESHQGKVSDKWELYLEVYEGLFADWRDKSLALLEIGVQNGGSLEIWSQYFAHAAAIVGCDINPACAHLRFVDPRITVVVGDANTDETEAEIGARQREYDIIIDDGSHKSSDIIRSFARYFSHLKEGGIYLVEDLHCSYWGEAEGGLFNAWSSISFFKRLADIVNFEHWGGLTPRSKILEAFSLRYGPVFDERELARIHAIEFLNSLCVIRKRASARNAVGIRVVAGSDEEVVAGLLAQRGTAIEKQEQSDHQDPIVVEAQLRGSVLRCEAQVAFLTQALNERSDLLNECASQRDALTQTLGERDALLNECVSQRDALTQTLGERDALLNECVSQRDALIASASWRITRPMRVVAGLLRGERSYWVRLTKSLDFIRRR